MLPSSSFFIFVTLISCFVSIAEAQGKGYSGSRLVYPAVHRIKKTWSFRSAKAKGNVTYSDPYFWLEGNSTNKDIQKFVSDQTNLTEQYIKSCKGKDAITQSLLEASTFDQYNHVTLVTPNTGEEAFYYYNLVKGGDQAPIWYFASMNEFQTAKKTNFNKPPGKLFLDESKLSSDGSASIMLWSNSPNGKLFGYLVITPDTVGTWYFRNFNSPLLNPKTFPAGGEGRIKDNLLSSNYFITWHPDNKGIFYPQIADPNAGTNLDHGYKIIYHALGTDSTKDIIIFNSKNAGEHGEDSNYFTYVSPDGKWLILSGYYDISSVNMVTYATLLNGQTISSNMKWISLSPSYDFSMYTGGVIDDEYYFETNKDAENRKVAKIKLDWSKARQIKTFTELQDRSKVIDVIPQRKDALIPDFGIYATAKDKFLVTYIENGQNTFYMYDAKTGKLIEKLLANEHGTIREIINDQNSNTIVVQMTTYNTPSKMFELKWKGKQSETSLATVQQIKGSNPEDFTVEQLFATSKDGTKVPYFITYRKGIKRDGKSPLWLHAYAAYGVIDNLYYAPSYFDFLRSYDGYFVFAGARGGGDRGGKWHDAGSGLNKQKTFDDILAIAKDVIKLQYTSPGNIILEGGSGGGMAMAAVVNQAPAGMIGIGILIRAPCDIFQLETRTTIGVNNRAEFGDVTTPEGFDAVRAWSPLQNVNPKKQYPAVLLTPGSADEVVPPSSSYKLLAQLQHDHPNNDMPLLMYVAQNKGHVPPSILESSYQFCMIEEALGLQRRKG